MKAPTSSGAGEYLVQVREVSLRRDGHDILCGVSLRMKPGEVHALLGLNGSGKSSLAYALMGCEGYRPDQGEVWFAGQDITRLSITERARLGLTLAWQEPVRFEGLPVGVYLALGAKGPDRTNLAEGLEAVALAPDAYMTRSVNHTLSGGERKRIELAAVYAMQARLAILDEPDSGVDMLTLDDIAQLVRRMADQGTAILLITHRDQLVSAADSASLLCQGRIAFQGKPGEARDYYGQRCRLHDETAGSPPWKTPQGIGSGAPLPRESMTSQ